MSRAGPPSALLRKPSSEREILPLTTRSAGTAGPKQVQSHSSKFVCFVAEGDEQDMRVERL